jgi:serine/threonine protein kinase
MKFKENHSLGDGLERVQSKAGPVFWNLTGISIVVCGLTVGLEFIIREISYRDIKPANILMNELHHC